MPIQVFDTRSRLASRSAFADTTGVFRARMAADMWVNLVPWSVLPEVGTNVDEPLDTYLKGFKSAITTYPDSLLTSRGPPLASSPGGIST